MNNLLRFVRRLLSGGVPRGPTHGVFLFQRRACEQAMLLVRMFYAGNLFWAGWRLSERARWLAFAGALVAGAIENSFGRIGNASHAWVWVALVFACLPNGWSNTWR